MKTDTVKKPVREHAIAQRIADAVQPTKIYLFGSRATGSANIDSDVDLFVIYDGPMEMRNVQMAIRRALRERQYSLDLVVTTSDKFERYKHVANTLAREVSEKGVLIYG
ncbi:nucleotidyltransferase domain-containing protein [bacterium]|nr:nucleotidyltransferase domain-containing protein [bacterium]